VGRGSFRRLRAGGFLLLAHPTCFAVARLRLHALGLRGEELLEGAMGLRCGQEVDQAFRVRVEALTLFCREAFGVPGWLFGQLRWQGTEGPEREGPHRPGDIIARRRQFATSARRHFKTLG
jgi:hypothetical protein